MSLFILQTVQKFGEATGDALRAFLSRILKNLAFTISKPIFITYNTPFYNIPYIKTSIFLTLHLNIISLLLFIFFISHSPSVSLSHYLSIFLNPVRLLPPSDICSQNFRGLSFSSSSLINHGHSHNHGHHHHQPQPQPPTTKKKKTKKKTHGTNQEASPFLWYLLSKPPWSKLFKLITSNHGHSHSHHHQPQP